MMVIGDREFDVANNTYVMGILNVTDDSFSDGGRYSSPEAALEHAGQMIREGADIIDVGGESTRPGYLPVSEAEETERVVPVIRAIKQHFDIPVSLDTCKPGVAYQGIKAGADMINDIWGLQRGSGMGRVIAEGGVACCLMHNREDAPYSGLIRDLIGDMRRITEAARTAGIPHDKIILDPGLGFAKDTQQNLEVLNRLGDIIGAIPEYPWLVGASRKSMIGNALGLPVGERLEGTLVTTVFAVMKGAAFVRVHDVRANRRAVLMTRALLAERVMI